MRLTHAIAPLFLLTALGCDPPRYGIDPDEDDLGADMSEDTPDDGPPIACEPLTACPEGACGATSDGCGGQLSCAPCACEGGQPTRPGCGLCELSPLRCDGEQGSCEAIPFSSSAQLDCDTGLVYVDASATGEPDGSKDAPYPTLQAAIDASADQGPRAILIAGSPIFPEAIRVANGVSILGGFREGDWAPDATFRPTIQAPDTGADIIGVSVNAVRSPTLIHGLDVRTPDATGPSANNYGVHVLASANLTLSALNVRSGQGGPGADGADGLDGADGGDGVSVPIARAYNYCSAGGECQDGFVAAGGVNSQCPMAKGGAGGWGPCSTQGGDYPPRKGEDAAFAQGGVGGVSVAGQESGRPGVSASVRQMTNLHGTGGESLGQITNGTWEPLAHGEAGLDGEFGSGGGGGGGAYLCEDLNPSTGRCPYAFSAIGEGAGGGAGGCGGTGGQGGQSGGGAFGAFLAGSELKVYNSSLSADSGGAGGAGGAGGVGGAGGRGGIGNSRYEVADLNQMPDGTIVCSNERTINSPNRSGDGGNGAPGSPGGHGGGGAGGVSFGAFCHESTVVFGEQVMLASEGSAPGGASLGNAGAPGRSASQEGCQ